MARIDGNIEWLVDEVNGQIVGQKRPDGKEISLATVETNPLTGGSIFSVGGSNVLTTDELKISAGYFCHLFAGDQTNGDGAFYDLSGAQNDGAFGANLTKAIAWATPGYATTATALADQVFRLPALNFDYAAGESLLIFWKGRGTAPASTKNFLADSPGSSTAGVAVRVDNAGRLQCYLSGGGSGAFCDLSTNVLMEGSNTHSFCVAFDGVNRKYEQHEDGAVVRSLITFNSGASKDTKTTATFNIGTGEAAPGFSSNSVAVQTQALVILRGRIGLGLPANYRQLMQALHRNPGKLVLREAW